MYNKTKNVIFGIEGLELKPEEREFFQKEQPLGFILFARNIDTPEQVKQLTNSLRDCVEHSDVPILIDQEGGRVQRLKPPHFRGAKPAAEYSKLAEIDLEKAKEAVFLNHYLIGKELFDLGINMDCAPVADLIHPGAHEIVGDRSFGSDINIVTELSKSADEGLRAAGVQSIMKHIPGHGRAFVDSHYDLPIVNSELNDLENSDFQVFKNLSSSLKTAMTAHMVFESIDPHNSITLSPQGIDYIRTQIGFDGIIFTDDLSMKALKGSFTEKVQQAQEAGCDIMLHCNGKMEEMIEIAAASTHIDKELANKLNALSLEQPSNNPYANSEPTELEETLIAMMETQTLHIMDA